MRKIKILDLYGEALGLTGDRKNIRAFEARLAEMGHEYETSCLGLGDEISFADYDVIFMTHGKPHIVAADGKGFCEI